ncbi:MAG TPA: hypothetical protein VGO56_07550 [Pyrinomonadaceae bacterium]|nr:hypothetical protein [Pyrinomonadaceae bacterium]
MERLVTEIDNNVCALETRKALGAAPPRELEITRVQRLHLWLPSSRISDAPGSVMQVLRRQQCLSR